jgi:transcriptional regulator with XRE-family HTH domain
METVVNQRVKAVREALEINQRNFAKILSISHGHLAGIETNIRAVNGRLVKLLVSEFGVNEEWLLTGEGEMFSRNPDEKFTRLVSLFKELPPRYQELIYQIIEILLKIREPD